MSEVVLSVRHLRTEFVSAEGVFPAVRDVSFDLHRLERLGIVGESGAGKSALALSILGLIEPPGRVVGGEVHLKGRDLRSLGEAALDRVRGKEISLVFQDPTMALDPIKSVGRQMVEAIRRHQQVTRQRARTLAIELLRDAEVPYAERRLDDYPHHYSGGMRQRVLIAMALANQPDVLIADEPTTALDVTTQAQILDLLQRLAADRGAAIMLITHNLGVVAEFCTSVQVMYAGRIVERGAIDEVLQRPAHPYTEALLASVPRPGRHRRGRLPAIPGFPPSLAALPRGCSFEPRCPVGNGLDVCIAKAPAPQVVEGMTGPVLAECHFTAERVVARTRPPALGDQHSA
jgi:oligopeptide/dipeptide ABC transporter ATP-binding protein